jgi:hypothetical protein
LYRSPMPPAAQACDTMHRAPSTGSLFFLVKGGYTGTTTRGGYRRYRVLTKLKSTGRAEQRMGKEAGCKCEPHRHSPSATKALVQRQLLRREKWEKEKEGVAVWGKGWECYTRRNRPGAATRGQQQPAVGHKSSKERPTRQGKSSQHSAAAAAEGATGAGYPESGRKRDRRGGTEGRPGRPMRERVGGQLAKQCMQLPAGVGASRRRHPPGSRQGGPAVCVCVCVCVCVLHGYYPQARNPDSSRNSCWIWNSLSSTDGSTMPPHPRADGPHHSSAETSLPRKPSVPESISSGGFEPTTSDVSRDPAPYLTSRPTTREGAYDG